MPHAAVLHSDFIVLNLGTVESCPSSPLFIPAKPVKKSAKKHIKERTGASSDSEDLAVAGTKATSERKRRRGQTNQRGSKDKAAGCKEGHGGRERRDSERSPVTEKSGEKTRTRKHLKTAGNAAALLTEENQKTTGENRFGRLLSSHCVHHYWAS